MQGEKTETSNATAAKVIRIDDYGSRRSRQIVKQQKRIRTVDDKFASLDERSQRAILSHMIGYMRASRELISSGKRAHTNEVSSIFEAMEDMINRAWKGGMI